MNSFTYVIDDISCEQLFFYLLIMIILQILIGNYICNMLKYKAKNVCLVDLHLF